MEKNDGPISKPQDAYLPEKRHLGRGRDLNPAPYIDMTRQRITGSNQGLIKVPERIHLEGNPDAPPKSKRGPVAPDQQTLIKRDLKRIQAKRKEEKYYEQHPYLSYMTEEHRRNLQFPKKLQLGKSTLHFTDAGKKLESMYWHTNPETRESEEWYLDSLDPDKKPTVFYYASDFPNCNCHSFTFTNGQAGWLNPSDVQNILDDNGFTKIGTFENNAELVCSQPQIGDIVIFRESEKGPIMHSGVISRIIDGQIQVTSKRGSRGLYEQKISTFPLNYGLVIEIYHTNREGGRFLEKNNSHQQI